MNLSTILIHHECANLGISTYPFAVAGGSIVIFLVILPAIYLNYCRDAAITVGELDLRILAVTGEPYFVKIPTISKTWRNRTGMGWCILGFILLLLPYNICMATPWQLGIYDLIVCWALLVFLINSEPPPNPTEEEIKKSKIISTIHSVLAIILFTGIAALSPLIIANYFGWQPWPIILLCLLEISYAVLIIGSLASARYHKDKKKVVNGVIVDTRMLKNEHWEWASWVALFETFLALFFSVELITFPSGELV